jgi:formylglycine-generating enzyme required for sulfatase activity
MLSDLKSVQDDTDMGVTLQRPAASANQRGRKVGILAGAASLLLVVAGLCYWQVQETWETEALMARLQPAIEQGRLNEVFEQLQLSGLDLNDSRFDALAPSIAGRVTIDTVPSSASVSVVRVTSVEDFSEDRILEIGETPISGYRLVAGEYLVRIAEEGFSPAELLIQLDLDQTMKVSRSLLEESSETQGMVLVEEGSSLVLMEGEVVPAFLIDRNEVTNEQFLEFVASGGYRDPAFWPNSLLVDGIPTPWSDGVKVLVDRTGLPGPRGWSGGTFPEGHGDHPVVGVSWYEASAYAMWANKELPTWNQWWRAALGEKGEVFPWGADVMTVEARSNFGLEGTGPVGTNILGISPFGCYDMAGSVREWLRDEIDGERQTVGGSWLDPSYMFEPSHAEFFEPSYANEAIGFRCVRRWK